MCVCRTRMTVSFVHRKVLSVDQAIQRTTWGLNIVWWAEHVSGKYFPGISDLLIMK